LVSLKCAAKLETSYYSPVLHGTWARLGGEPESGEEGVVRGYMAWSGAKSTARVGVSTMLRAEES
jgi:hypothetical protein